MFDVAQQLGQSFEVGVAGTRRHLLLSLRLIVARGHD